MALFWAKRPVPTERLVLSSLVFKSEFDFYSFNSPALCGFIAQRPAE
jgi:hypothetical protein